MTDRFTWSTAWKIAWREARAARVKFFFVILAVAAGTGALTGVRGFATSFRVLLLKEARTLLAGDLSVRLFALPSPDQQALLDDLTARGARRSQVTETITMASVAERNPILVSVKAVDPATYPLYGELRFEPAGRIGAVLTPEQVAVSQDLLIRLDAQTGATIRVGGQDFRIAAVVAREPDRMAGTLNVGPRLMMSQAGLERTGLIREGSRASQRFLYRLPAQGIDLDATRARLKEKLPEAQVIDYRETHPTVTRGLNRASTFLSLISLIALIVGALGVATAMHAHLAQKMDSIAVMKCLGARSSQVIRIYLLQTLALGLIGGVAGIGVGALVQRAFPLLISRYFQVTPELVWDPFSVLQGLGTGVLTTLLFTMPPLLSIRGIRPGVILRRSMSDSGLARRRDWKSAAGAGVLILLGLAGIAATLTDGSWNDSARLGGWFAGGLAVSLGLLAGVAWLLLRGLRVLQRNSRWALPASVRHGIANLYRPGNQAPAVLTALGVGVMFTLTVYLVQHSMLGQIRRSAPPGMPNVFLIDIQAAQKDAVFETLKTAPGVAAPPEIFPSVSLRVTAVDGVPPSKLDLKGFARRFLGPRSVTWAKAKPEFTDIVQGEWVNERPGFVSVSEDAAKVLRVKPGSVLEFTGSGLPLRAAVAGVHKTESIRLGASVEFIFAPKTLDAFPVIYYGGVRVAPAKVAELQRLSYSKFPTVTVINIADVLEIVQEVIDQISVVIRFISGFAILAGVVILASSVAGTRFRRIRETVILKTLGGTRPRIAGIFSVEFLVLGAVAGLMGSLLGLGFTRLIFSRFFEGEFEWTLWPAIVAVLLTAATANFAGWLASWRILGQKPLEVLREE